MILLLTLLLIIAMLTVVVIGGVATVGATAILIFGDVIVCIVFLIMLIRWIISKK